MSKLTGAIFLCIFVTILFLPSDIYSENSGHENLAQLIEEALKNNPAIQEAYHLWKAQEQQITQAKSLPDPMASYTYFGKNVETKVGPQEQKYGLSQNVPFPGKLGLKAKTQAKGAEMLKERYEATQRSVIKDVKFTFYDIFWIDRAIQITAEEEAILGGLEKVVRRKYESNLTPQQDVLKVQVELSRLVDKLFLFKQRRKSLVAKMNSFLSRPKDAELGNVDIKPEDFTYQLDELHKMAKETSQQLQAANLDIERTEYEKSLARLDYLPDFTLGFDYIQVGDGHTTVLNDGEDAWMGKIAINVPIWFGKLKAQLEEKEAKLEATRKHYENVENSVVSEVEDLYFKIITYNEIISLYETALIPQTEQSIQAAKTAYETGKVDFLNWLDAERVFLQTRLAYYKAIVDYQKSIAYLERIIGKNL